VTRVADLSADEGPERFSKEHRRQQRARVTRLGRLPGPFQTFGNRSRGHAALVWILQALIVLAVALPLLKVITGQWLPPFAGVVVLALALALQSACRKVNLKAEQEGRL
jgi:predicted nucleic acid-binding Zn ribbon protein